MSDTFFVHLSKIALCNNEGLPVDKVIWQMNSATDVMLVICMSRGCLTYLIDIWQQLVIGERLYDAHTACPTVDAKVLRFLCELRANLVGKLSIWGLQTRAHSHQLHTPG